jgi:hypothetical protein
MKFRWCPEQLDLYLILRKLFENPDPEFLTDGLTGRHR